MYAVVKTGGKQYRVEQGQRLRVERLGAPDSDVELTPVLLTSATRVMGVSLLLDFMLEGVRQVEDHMPLRVDRGEPPALGPDAPFTARVFKTVIDPYMGKVSMLRVLGGSLKAGDPVVDTTKGAEVKTAHLYVPEGKDLKEVKELTAGMIGALNKADVVSTGDTLAQPGVDLVLSQIRMPEPVMAVALFPKARADEDKLGDALHRLLEADPGLRLERNADTRETVLWGMGHVHLEIAAQVLKERYGVDVDTRTPSVAYRETIAGTGDAQGKYIGIPGVRTYEDLRVWAQLSLTTPGSRQAAMRTWTDTFTEDTNTPIPPAMMSEADADEYADIMADLQTYILESVAKFTTGEWSVDANFDDFVAQCRVLGAERALELQDKAIKNWQARGGEPYAYTLGRAEIDWSKIPLKTEKGIELMDPDLR